VLVDGARAAHFETTPDATLGGHVRLDVVDGVHRRDVTALAGGKLGGEIAFRDGAAAQAAADLDQLAFDLASRLNTTHRAGAALDGSTGRDLFVQPAAPAGAAAAMALDPAVSADPRLLAVAATGAGPSDNRNGLALAALGNQLLAGGGTRSFTDEAIHSLGALGLAARQAKGDADVEQARGDALAALRDGLSGVSLEDEMVRLSQFQHAAEAATRFVSTVDNMLNDMIKNL
jgi:flagellar hook-associated protein 1 FlgK